LETSKHSIAWSFTVLDWEKVFELVCQRRAKSFPKLTWQADKLGILLIFSKANNKLLIEATNLSIFCDLDMGEYGVASINLKDRGE